MSDRNPDLLAPSSSAQPQGRASGSHQWTTYTGVTISPPEEILPPRAAVRKRRCCPGSREKRPRLRRGDAAPDLYTYYSVAMTQALDWSIAMDTDSYETIAVSGRHRRRDAEAASGRAPEHADAWGQGMTETIAGEIRRWRQRRSISAQQLSDRCAVLGHPVPRNVIANLESRRRNAITVPELIIIAMALNVPPVLLIYPLGADSAVDVAPEQGMTPWGAMRWFAAEKRPSGGMLGGKGQLEIADAMREWEDAYAIIVLYRRHDILIRRYRFMRDDIMAELRRLAEPSTADHDERSRRDMQSRADYLAREMVKAIDALRRHRAQLSDLGYALPPVPPDIDLGDGAIP